MKTVAKIGLVLIFLIFCLLTLPALHFFSTLRPAEAYTELTHLNDLFSRHEVKFSSQIRSGTADQRVICTACKANASLHQSCAHAMSSFVAENLVTQAGSKLFWDLDHHLRGLAVRLKYGRDTLESIYLALLANIFGKQHVDHVCEDFFSKNCQELTPKEGALLGHAFHLRQPPELLASESPEDYEDCWR